MLTGRGVLRVVWLPGSDLLRGRLPLRRRARRRGGPGRDVGLAARPTRSATTSPPWTAPRGAVGGPATELRSSSCTSPRRGRPRASSSSTCATRPAPRCPPGRPARTSTSCCPATWSGSTRCAATRPTARPGGSPSCASPRAAAARRYVHDELAPATRSEVRGPRNHFPLEPAPRYLFVAGGIGITPILPMIAAADAAGAEWRAACTAAARRASMAFAGELRGRSRRPGDLRPQDEHGLLDLDAPPGRAATPDTLVYCCGPGPAAGRGRAACAGWPPGTLHVERFTPKDAGRARTDGAFEVELAAHRAHLHGPAGAVDPRGRRGGGRTRSCPPVGRAPAAPARPRARGTVGPPRLAAHPRGAGGRRHHVHLRLPRRLPEAGPRTLTPTAREPPMQVPATRRPAGAPARSWPARCRSSARSRPTGAR